MPAARPYYAQLRTAAEGTPDRRDGSRTITIEQPDGDNQGRRGNDDDDRGEGTSSHDYGVLRLRGGPTADPGHRVQWEEGTVDNEFLNRKKSKICCIYHKPRTKNFEDPFADSSDSSSNESDGAESSEEGKIGGQEPQGASQDHDHGLECCHSPSEAGQQPHVNGLRRVPPNAYEHQPTYNKTKKTKKKKDSGTITKKGGSSTMVETVAI